MVKDPKLPPLKPGGLEPWEGQEWPEHEEQELCPRCRQDYLEFCDEVEEELCPACGYPID